MRTVRPRQQAGFNLVETVVASMILSGAVLTLSSICTNAVVGTRLNQHYKVAASVMERQLTLIDFMGIDEFIESGQTEGAVEELDPGYQWAVTTEYQGTDNVYVVSITVSWLEGKRPHQIMAQTMLNGAGAVTLSGTEGP